MTPAGTPDVKARVGRLLARQARNTRAGLCLYASAAA
jgi:hypothetical protein